MFPANYYYYLLDVITSQFMKTYDGNIDRFIVRFWVEIRFRLLQNIDWGIEKFNYSFYLFTQFSQQNLEPIFRLFALASFQPSLSGLVFFERCCAKVPFSWLIFRVALMNYEKRQITLSINSIMVQKFNMVCYNQLRDSMLNFHTVLKFRS